MLILDELSDSPGTHHRQEVLEALAKSTQEHGITVLGTCQESLLDDAAEHCGELLYFTCPSHTEALNAPTRMFGYDANGERVELTTNTLLAGRTWWCPMGTSTNLRNGGQRWYVPTSVPLANSLPFTARCTASAVGRPCRGSDSDTAHKRKK